MTRHSPKKERFRCPPKFLPAEPSDKWEEPDAIPQDPQELQELLLERILAGGKLCHEVESQLRQFPSPELETIIKLHRVLVLGLSAEAQTRPGRFNLVAALMKPVMEWARLEEKRKLRELAEQKYRDQSAAKKSEQNGPGASLTPGTLDKIERELNLF